MRVLLTGGTGYVGSGIARALLGRGHCVIGIARSRASADDLRAAGVVPVLGAIDDQDLLRRTLVDADAVVLAAFHRDYLQDLDAAVALDRTSVRATLTAVAGTSKPVVYTSGLGVVGPTGDRPVTEDTPVSTPPAMRWRRDLEREVLAAGGIVLRLPLVYGRGGGHVLEAMIHAAVAHGRAVYPAPGTGAWPNVHIDDLGLAYALALEQAPVGTLLHVVGGTSAARAMSEAVAMLTGGPGGAVALPLAKARLELPVADFMTIAQHVDGTRCRTLLGWEATGPPITTDIITGSYRAWTPPPCHLQRE